MGNINKEYVPFVTSQGANFQKWMMDFLISGSLTVHWQVRDVDYGQKTDTQHCCVFTNDNDRYLKLHYVWIRNEQVDVNSCMQQWTYQLLTVCAPRGELEDWIWNLRRVQLLHLSEQQHNISWVSMNNINQLLLVSHFPIVSHQDYTLQIIHLVYKL